MANEARRTNTKTATGIESAKEDETYNKLTEEKNTKRQPQKTLTIQEEINRKTLVSEGWLKMYRDRVKQQKQIRTFQNKERNSYQEIVGKCTKT